MQIDPAELADLRDKGLEWAEVGGPFGLSADEARLRVRRYRERTGQTEPTGNDEVVSFAESAGEAVVYSNNSSRIRTLDQLLDACQVDLSQWYVERWVANKWDMGSRTDTGTDVTELYQVKAWLKPTTPYALATELLAELKGQMADAAVLRPWPSKPHAGGDHMLEVAVFDAHIGMLSWGQETGTDWDTAIAAEVIGESVVTLVERAKGYGVESILLPLGHDFLHADSTIGGAGGATTKGTSIDVDSRFQRMTRAALSVAVTMIDTLREVAPVHAVIVPGNHDQERMFLLGEVLAAYYRHDPVVTITNSPRPRHYIRYGVTLLGLTHGHEVRSSKELPLLMAREAADDWAATTHQEWHCGHLHRKGEMVEEHTGVRVRVIPSLAAEDAWAHKAGYHHHRAAEAYLFHKTDGFAGMLSVSIPERFRWKAERAA